jgi:cyclopropane-fatty-acyl-phospholipid synthase
MTSFIQTGRVMHARLQPRSHAFTYPAFFFTLDLDDLPALNRWWPLAGYNRRAILSFWDRDYLDRKPGAWREKVDRLLAAHGCADGVASVKVVTCARYFGYIFNPVSFYYALRADGSLRCAVAEVNNTFQERHLYTLTEPLPAPSGFLARFRANKQFHVSPFNDMRGTYDFLMSPPGADLDVRVDLVRDGQTVMKTQLAGSGHALSPTRIAAVLLRYPITAALTFPRIAWQAFRLRAQKRLAWHHKPVPQSESTVRTAPPTFGQRLCLKMVSAFLGRMRHGQLILDLPGGERLAWGVPAKGQTVRMRVKDHRMFSRLVRDGDIGLAESYINGEWETADLTALIALFIANRDVLDDGEPAWAWLGRSINRLRHRARPNTKRGSRQNITAHYDLSNDFFRLFLDPTMMYSCALYEKGDETLEEAQIGKLHALIKKARISPEHHVLEIGSGWGAFAIEAVRQKGCRVTTVTISTQQYELARKRVREAGLEDRIAVRLCDYRDIDGRFDRIVSIEMLEAVGHEFLGEYFRVCDRVLKPGGVIALQVITIPDARYDAYRKSVDFIQKHIFPGGHLPSMGALSDAMARSSRLVVEQLDHIGAHYAPTLRAWRERFLAAAKDVRALGFDDAFIRKWLYYFSYCEAAFATQALDNLHMVLSRPAER